MKLILTQEVSNLGTAGDVVEVKDGYGRNYLVPQGFAMRWTRGAEKQIEGIQRSRAAREIRDRGHAQEIKAQLEALSVRINARAGAGGRLFGSVTVADVVDAVRSAGGPALDKRRVEVGTIKTAGKHEFSVRLHSEVTAKVPVEVVAG